MSVGGRLKAVRCPYTPDRPFHSSGALRLGDQRICCCPTDYETVKGSVGQQIEKRKR